MRVDPIWLPAEAASKSRKRKLQVPVTLAPVLVSRPWYWTSLPTGLAAWAVLAAMDRRAIANADGTKVVALMNPAVEGGWRETVGPKWPGVKSAGGAGRRRAWAV